MVNLFIFLSTFLFHVPGKDIQSAERPVLHTGDTIYLARDLLPYPIDLYDTGDDLFWDMSRLLSPFVHQSIVRPDGTGGFILSGADDVERFLVEKPEGLFVTGLGITNFSLGNKSFVSIEPPLPLVKPGGLGDTWEYQGTLTYTTPALKRTVKLTMFIHAQIDASGELYSPTARYDVMRERRDIELIVAPGKVDVNPVELGLPPGFLSGRVYLFLSDLSPIPVAVVQADAMNQAKQVEYVTHPWAGTVVQQMPSRPEVFVYPNPSFGNVRFDFFNLPADDYDLEIYNILGTKIRTEHIFINGSKTLPLDLSRLKKGTYIYRLVDSQRNTIRSKRLVIITP